MSGLRFIVFIIVMDTVDFEVRVMSYDVRLYVD